MSDNRRKPRNPLRLNNSIESQGSDNQLFSKKYYRIQDVADFVGVSPTTIRFWEKQFDTVNPVRSSGNVRYYTPDDIRQLQVIHYLVRVKGMKIEVAKEQLKKNPKNISRRVDVISGLKMIREELQSLLSALEKRR